MKLALSGFLLPLLGAACVLVPASSQAGPGTLEINQACVADGCFAGDEPGWPVTIAATGSYALTSDLEVSSADHTAIQISSPHVTLDLGGFLLSGPTRCSGAPMQCAPGGTGRGIDGSNQSHVNIRQGRVLGFPGYLVSVGGGSRVADLSASDGLVGIAAGRGSVVERCVVSNTRFGLETDAIVRDCSITGTHQAAVQRASILEHTYIADNLGIGVYVNSPALIGSNKIIDNGGAGIIVESDGVNLVDNLVHGNATGLRVMPVGRAAGKGNVFSGNTVSAVRVEVGGLFLETGGNVCGTALGCP